MAWSRPATITPYESTWTLWALKAAPLAQASLTFHEEAGTGLAKDLKQLLSAEARSPYVDGPLSTSLKAFLISILSASIILDIGAVRLGRNLAASQPEAREAFPKGFPKGSE